MLMTLAGYDSDVIRCSSAKHLVSAKQEDLSPMHQVVPMKVNIRLIFHAKVRLVIRMMMLTSG